MQTRSLILDSHITKQISTVSLDQHWKILPLSYAMLPTLHNFGAKFSVLTSAPVNICIVLECSGWKLTCLQNIADDIVVTDLLFDINSTEGWELLINETLNSLKCLIICYDCYSYVLLCFLVHFVITHCAVRHANICIIIIMPRTVWYGLVKLWNYCPLPSARQHPSYGDCLEVKREYHQTAPCWVHHHHHQYF